MSVNKAITGLVWFRKWLAAYSAPGHYLNRCSLIVNWTLRNKFQWNLDPNEKILTQENQLEDVIYKIAAILSDPWMKNLGGSQKIYVTLDVLTLNDLQGRWARWKKKKKKSKDQFIILSFTLFIHFLTHKNPEDQFIPLSLTFFIHLPNT